MNLDIKELRVGNLVLLEGDVLHEVEDETFSNIVKGWYSEKDFFPIPLTEEILHKCRFNFKELGFEDLAVSYGLSSKEIHFVISNYYVRIHYIHQLQNLYFALTRKELEVKL